MNVQTKKVPIYVYFLTIEQTKAASNVRLGYDMKKVVAALNIVIKYILQQNLSVRSIKDSVAHKAIWLDNCEFLDDGNYNLIFKSAKFNHVRNEIDTDTMTSLGWRRRPQDGEEERTHLCIRLGNNSQRFLAVHESNHYGLSIAAMIGYLNAWFEKYNEEHETMYHYKISYEIIPSDDFISQIKKARSFTALHISTTGKVFNDDFLALAGRDELTKSFDIIFNRPRGFKNIPENTIRAYYNEMQSNQENSYVTGITVFGKGLGNEDLRCSTDLIKMRHTLNVECEAVTNEVNSSNFFSMAQEFINSRR